MKVLNHRLGVGGGKDVAFDDAVVKEPIKDIRDSQAGFARTEHTHQLFVGVQFREKINIFVNFLDEFAPKRERGQKLLCVSPCPSASGRKLAPEAGRVK